jgi:MFS family permease
LLSVAGFGVATIIFGLSSNLYLSLAMLFLTGAFDQVSMVVRHTMVQLTTPDAMRGRVSAVNGVFVSASNELGGFESGLVAHWFGPIVAVVSGGIGTLLVVVVTAWSSPKLRRFGSLGEIHTRD